MGRTERKGSAGCREGEREFLAARHHRDHFPARKVVGCTSGLISQKVTKVSCRSQLPHKFVKVSLTIAN